MRTPVLRPLRNALVALHQPQRAHRPHRSPLGSLAHQPIMLVCLAYLLLLVVLATLAPLIARHDPLAQDLLATLQTPSSEHWLGTDHLGRDVFSRLLFGARTSLQAAAFGMMVALLVGVPAGLLAGYHGGWVERALMTLADTVFVLPLLLIAMSVIAVLGNGLGNAMLAVGIGLAAHVARLTRALVIEERGKAYVEGGRVIGLRAPRLILRYLLPNILSPLLVQASLMMGVIILIESALSFLGLGLAVGYPSWGGMLADARVYIRVQPFLPVPPGLAIMLTVLAFNLLGDGLRDAFASPQSQPATPRKKPTALVALPLAQDTAPAAALLHINRMSVVRRDDGTRLVDDVSLHLLPGQTLGLVGESGAGKTLISRALLNLLPAGLERVAGRIYISGRDMTHQTEAAWRQVRGRVMALIPQQPHATLTPSLTVGDQLTELLRHHQQLSRKAAYDQALALLHQVGINRPRQALSLFPYQLSGGMAQRVALARALCCQPEVLIADEPTTALDVIVQRQVLDLLARVQAERSMALLFISHDLGVIASLCDETAVMHAGQIVEQGPTHSVFAHPQHPYTRHLLDAARAFKSVR